MIYYKLIVDYVLNDEEKQITYDAITFNAEYGSQQETSTFNTLVKRDSNVTYFEKIVADPTLVIKNLSVYKDDEEVYSDNIWTKLARIYVVGDSTGELSKNLQFVVGE